MCAVHRYLDIQADPSFEIGIFRIMFSRFLFYYVILRSRFEFLIGLLISPAPWSLRKPFECLNMESKVDVQL